MKVGFIGLGIMGSAMANNLLKDGIKLNIYNRSKQKINELATDNFEFFDNPKLVAQNSDIIFLMLSNDEACENVVNSENGLLEGLENGKIVVNFSTVSASYSQNLYDKVKNKNALFLEAPVVGSKIPAQNAQLIILCAGDKKAYETVNPYFKKLSKRVFYLDNIPNASYLKIVNNQVMGITMQALAEGLQLAKKLNLDLNVVLDLLNFGAFANSMFELKGKNILSNNYEAHFPYEHMQKDLGFAVKLAEDKKAFCPALSIVNETYKKGLANYSKIDMCAIYEALNS
ncbi:NAD(P)-dependent oxidoreductase [Desulfurella multipotens]|uniref:NAD(P)-dependent oxidoreductase n=1 Tax=Desulfurella multipotens TaxID=79269 RepID=UPI000CBE741B|nr:NAD(P)-dependent oxidoreductase [Desulfurella multipotens]PMP69224.1 MAG: NAD(P)-dependent oxidoreductase [Desulfurella multipotens]